MRSRLSQLVGLTVLLVMAATASAQEAKHGAYPPLQMGSPAARHKVEIFSDFQCPAASHFFRLMREVVARHPDDVQVTFRNFPLARHKNAIPAARAVEAAAAQGKWIEMMQLIFDTQDKWTSEEDADAIFAKYAETLGLDMALFDLDRQSAVTADRIARDVERGKSLNVNGTPWVMLNDYPLAYGDALSIEKVISPQQD